MRGKHNPAVPLHQPHRASNCFSEIEVLLMAQLMETVLRGGDARSLTRAPDFKRVLGKFARMRSRIESRRRAA